MCNVLFDCSDFLIAQKPKGIPTVPLKTETGITLLSQVAEKYPEVLTVAGKNPWEGSACHRLDTATGGLVVFAKNQSFYNRIQEYQAQGNFIKTYIAVTDNKDGSRINRETIETYFRAYGPGRKKVKAEQDVKKADSNVLYKTEIEEIMKDTYRCTITRGFRHQIRVHLAFIGHPIKGDKLYNPDSAEKDLALDCIGISFPGFNFYIPQ